MIFRFKAPASQSQGFAQGAAMQERRLLLRAFIMSVHAFGPNLPVPGNTALA